MPPQAPAAGAGVEDVCASSQNLARLTLSTVVSPRAPMLGIGRDDQGDGEQADCGQNAESQLITHDTPPGRRRSGSCKPGTDRSSRNSAQGSLSRATVSLPDVLCSGWPCHSVMTVTRSATSQNCHKPRGTARRLVSVGAEDADRVDARGLPRRVHAPQQPDDDDDGDAGSDHDGIGGVDAEEEARYRLPGQQ